MEVTEYERHQLFVWFEEHLGPERAATMMNLMPPVGWFDLATKHDLTELEQRLELRFDALEARIDFKIDSKVDGLRAELMRTFGTWFFASQAAVIASLGLLITLR